MAAPVPVIKVPMAATEVNGWDLTRRFPELAAAVAALEPPTLDCLYARGEDLRKRPLRVRRNALEEPVDGLEAWAQVLSCQPMPRTTGQNLTCRVS